jgi:hypothetical protein
MISSLSPRGTVRRPLTNETERTTDQRTLEWSNPDSAETRKETYTKLVD